MESIRKSIFVSFITKRNIKDDYKFLKELGSGSFGVVFLVQHKITSEQRAVKAIAKDRIEDQESFSNEITILRTMDHPNILKLFEVYETDQTIYLVTELCEGGELFYHITQKQFLTEDEAAIVMRQIFSAIAYCHEKKICHRDIKPENFLLKYNDDLKSVKLIDFGLSKKLKENELLTQPNGTPFYIAPEILDGKYSWEVDNWSLGVVLYILLCGTPPFFGKSTKDIVAAIKKGVYTLSHKPFQICSIEVKDLISKLLVKDPKKRYTALQAYEHPWVKRQVDEESKNLKVDPAVFENINRILEAQTLKKTILLYIATQIPESEITNLKQIFYKIDKNGNGSISKDEMLQGMTEFKSMLGLKFTNDQIGKMFDAMDIDKSGSIDYTEFIAAFLDTVVMKQEKYLKEAFMRIDQDGSGKISRDELKALFGTDTFAVSHINIEELIDQADIDGDGEINYAEFLKLIKSSSKK